MTRFAAFLRAINVGGHVVKMDGLRDPFESLGFTNVETYIASGNVVFDSTARSGAGLETKIAKLLDPPRGAKRRRSRVAEKGNRRASECAATRRGVRLVAANSDPPLSSPSARRSSRAGPSSR